MSKGKKYYVVFKGIKPGVYDDWDDARMQVENFEGALFKGYASSQEATEAFRKATEKEDRDDLARLIFGNAKDKSSGKKEGKKAMEHQDLSRFPEIDLSAWAVDASCLGNPGVMEYQGVEVGTGKVIFRVGPFQDATNNIGEFLAIVHAMALMLRNGDIHNIYSDSVSGMAWIRTRKIKTTLKPTEKNKKVFELMGRAITWLNTHTFSGKVMKWQTERWGEIPADFGRK